MEAVQDVFVAEWVGGVVVVVAPAEEVKSEEIGGSIDADEREQLCLFIDEVLTQSGVDVAGLAARQGVDRYAITDRWRRW
ncbi:hypothetical protein ACQPW3_11780 [Actinosynnema sp. CA-248983]